MSDASVSAAGDLLAALVQAVPADQELPSSVETAVLRWLGRPGDESGSTAVLLELVKRKRLSPELRRRLGACSQVAVKAAWLSRDDHPQGYVSGQLAKEKRAKVLSAVIRSDNASLDLLRVASRDVRRMVQEAMLSRSDLPDDLLVEALVHTVVKPRTYSLRQVVSEWTSRRSDLVPLVVGRISDPETKVRLWVKHRSQFSTDQLTVLLESTVAPALLSHIDIMGGVGDSTRYSYWNAPETPLWMYAEAEVLFALVTSPAWVPSQTPRMLQALDQVSRKAGWVAASWQPNTYVSPVAQFLTKGHRTRLNPTPDELEMAHHAVFGPLDRLEELLEERSGSVGRQAAALARVSDVDVLMAALKDTAPGRSPEPEVVAAVLANAALTLSEMAKVDLSGNMHGLADGLSVEVLSAVAAQVWRRWQEDPDAAASLLLRFDHALVENLASQRVFVEPQFAPLASGLLKALKSAVGSESVSSLPWGLRNRVAEVVHLAGGSPLAGQLLSALPFTDLRWILQMGDSAELASAAAALLDKVSDDEQWETLLGLSETFRGSLYDLVELSAAV